MKQYYKLKLLFSLCLGLGISAAWGQTTVLDYTGEWVTYTVPTGVTSLNIEALGAQGASGQSGRVGGRGARMSGDFTVTPGDELLIVVGGKGQGQSSGTNGGGGGGTFVVIDNGIGGSGDYTINAGPFADHTVTPLIVAGGGSGTRSSVGSDGNPGVIGDMGTSGSGSEYTGGGTPVTAPEAGGLISSSSWGSGGGGFVGNGANDGTAGCGGNSFLNGAAGGTGCGTSGDNAAGGFGGGGQGRGSWGGGGGGGWSGGQGGRVAGGGGSMNIGTDQDNATGFRDGDGQVTIEILCLGLDTDIPVTGVCIGETLSLCATSLTGGTITWSGGVINCDPFAPSTGTTTYTATSTSVNDCPFEIDISASEIPDIVANSSSPTACEGAEIILWGTGGDTYEWSGTGDVTPINGTGFPAETGEVTYTVTGSFLGCEGLPDEITLVGAPQPYVEGNVNPTELCLGGSYILTGSGDGTVAFDWGASIDDGDELTPESAGTYVHTVIGVSVDGCYDTAAVTVVVHGIPFVEAGIDVTVCEGNEVTLSGTGAASYEWSPAITDSEAFEAEVGETTYTVTGTDNNGCTDTDEVVVFGVERPYITDSEVIHEYSGYNGAINITVAGGSGEYTYAWYHGPITQNVDGLTAGIYTVEINDITIDPGMCPTTSEFTITSFIGLDDASINMLNAYPNPTNDQLTIVFNGQFNYEVTSLPGQVMFTGSAVDQEELSLEELADGTYIVKVSAGDNVSFVQIVKH